MLQELQDVEDSVELHEVCTKIRESICSATMPEDLAEQIGKAYEELAKKVGEKNPFVAQHARQAVLIQTPTTLLGFFDHIA